jgi:hypothetical protein
VRTSPSDWLAQVHEDWEPIRVMLVGRGVPARELAWVGGGLVVMWIQGEDPDRYVWLGCAAHADGDGPWLDYRAEARFAGGYVYQRLDHPKYDDAFVSSDRVMVPIGDPLSDDSVVDALVEAWRQLRDAPTPHPL